MHTRRARFFSIVLPLVLAAFPLAAGAQLGGALPGTWRLNGGWFNSDATTTIRLDSERYGVGTEIDLEDDLGFATNMGVAFADLTWHFKSKHYLGLGYTDIDRTSTKTIDREIIWGDETYPVNGKISARFATRFVTLGYQYALYRREGFEIGPRIAIPIVSITVGAGVESASGTTQKQSKEVTVPPPLVGVYFSARLHPKFYLQGNADYMKATVFGYEFDMSNYRFTGLWLATTHVGGGLSWSGNTSHIGAQKTDALNGKITYDVSGPSLFITLRP